jgi:hypothetical protein
MSAMEGRRICRLCVMPESPPRITLDDTGLCSLCAAHREARRVVGDVKMLESDFTKIIAKHKGKAEYDCLVMCSGGKDSTAALYYMVRRYGMKPLAFTFDHGFETEEALDNVRRAVDALGVEFLFFKSPYMHGMFKKILESGSSAVICHLCSIWYMDLTFRMAERFQIPIIIAGWTKGQTSKQPVMSKCACSVGEPEYESMAAATKEFIAQHVRSDPRYKDFPETMEEVLRRAKKRHKSMVLSPHWFLPYDTETYVKTIQDELGWAYPKLSYPGRSTNCAMNFISVHNSMKYYGYTHYHVEMSKMIRDGLMTRDEALELLRIDFGADLLDEVAKPLGVTFARDEAEGRG